MILYLDTSSLLKLYISEPDSEQTYACIDQAEVVATSRIAYAEARAAFARKHRSGELARDEYQGVLRHFEGDWDRLFVLEVTPSVVELAGELAEKYPLRGFDAIHLASALMLSRKVESPVAFSCADEHLTKAARVEGMGTSL